MRPVFIQASPTGSWGKKMNECGGLNAKFIAAGLAIESVVIHVARIASNHVEAAEDREELGGFPGPRSGNWHQ